MTPRSCLRWEPMGKIFKTVGLRWVPTRKIFASSTTKVDSEPLNGSNADITNQNECEQTLDVSAGTLDLSADAHVASQQKLELLFGPLYDECFNAGSNPQDKQPTMNIQTTSAPSTPTYVHAEENNDNQAEEEHLPDDEFTNPFCALTQEVAESSSHNIEQVRRNPSRPVQTRRQLATNPEMYMFALTVSTAELKNIKEALADSAWIEAMQKELHQFDRLQEKGIDFEESFCSSCSLRSCLDFYRICSTQVFSNLLDGHENNGPLKEEAKYALEILHKHGMDKGQSIGTPMDTKPKLDADLSGNPIDQTDYRSKIGSFMYLTSSRPDIVQGGSSFGLTAFSDADHVGCINSRKSTSRGIQFLGDKLVSWMSKKQNYITMSSAEAEYVALSASCAQVMWMRTQLQDYGFNYNKIPLYCDSQSAIAILCNPVQHSHTKHIHTRYHFIKEQVENSIIELYFFRTEYQLADMFTKANPKIGLSILLGELAVRYVGISSLGFTQLAYAYKSKCMLDEAVFLLLSYGDKSCFVNSVCFNSLMSDLLKGGKLELFWKVCERLSECDVKRDVYTYGNVIKGYCMSGKMEDAKRVFSEMEDNDCSPNLVTYNLLIGGLCQNGLVDEAIGYKKVMVEKGVVPDAYSYSVIIDELCKRNRFSDAKLVLDDMNRAGLRPKSGTYSSLI
nr:hypothetical protein [Tanacetum cinerariifolium]